MLHLHRSERADRLVDGLAELLRDQPDDPFAVEVVAVPAKGVERWLSQRLSHVLGVQDGQGDGVCANVHFPHPSALVAGAVAASAGIRPEDDPWESGRLLWTLLELVDESVTEDWCSALAGHLGIGDTTATHRRGRRLTTAQHLGRLFDSYGAHRPAMLREWAQGNDDDGIGNPLPTDLAWQAELWRRVHTRIGSPSPAERLVPACEQLRDQPDLVDLPPRLSLFGPTRLTTAQLEVLAALAARREVHLWLPHPSPALWDRVAPMATTAAKTPRRYDPTVDVPRNPLLSSLGRDARELQLQLVGRTTDHHYPVTDRLPTLLGRLQQSLQDDTVSGPTLLQDDDRSLQVHACHGPARQVEVLREVLVGLLSADTTLEPRNVLVMCPDIEDYAPLISAAFGLADDEVTAGHPGHKLRVRLADRSLRQTNPLLATIASLLGLAGARVTASQVLDLASSQPVRRRFRFTDDDLERLQEWVATSGIRWGLDSLHRAPYGLATVPQNTWQAGLDRIALGVAMAEDDLRWLGLALPLDDVDSNDIDLAGRLAELIDRLTTALDGMTGEHPLQDWLKSLTDALDTLTATQDKDAWQGAEARRELAQIQRDAGDRAQTTNLGLADVHALLAACLEGKPTRANFRTGNLTMCSLVPMRSVPHRVVCLLGMDDGTFPRRSGLDGDDVLARDPCVGERDPRSEDRQLLLDAVLAAKDHLIVLYTGADPRTNARRPPAVPIGEILDAADAPRDHTVVRHPLQPFDARNFTAGALGVDGPFSFDPHALRGVERATQPRDQPAPFLTKPLAPDDDTDVSLDDLVGFLEQPVRGFLRQRLGVTITRDEDEVADGLCVELGGLEKWAVGDRLLKSCLAGADLKASEHAEWLRGSLPPGELGKQVLDAVRKPVERLLAASAAHRASDARSFDVAVDLGDHRLTGTVGSVYGTEIVRVEYSTLAPKHRLRAWAQLLALSVAYPETPWTAVTIGRGPRNTTMRSVLGPVDSTDARQHLQGLLDLRTKGLSEPLPIAVKTSAKYADKRAGGMPSDNALAMAGQEWRNTQFDGGGEQMEEAHQLVWGEAPRLELLTAEPPRPGEQMADETTRFAALARHLWEPLIAAETQGAV
ncbi:MAG: exodeoxyribonuclease V subunit gamma [Actinomycetota bacterium]|nr:exodeoxyribonuclease V subunit gamma [Actinomycetota bacterium]